jgi:hypothetical protein
MIAIAKSQKNEFALPWHEQFLRMLPAITAYAQISFQGLAADAREDLVEETICNCLVAFARLVELGKADLAYPSVLARYAVAHVRQGRRVGCKQNVNDVLSEYAQCCKGFAVESLDVYDDTQGGWREVLVEDRTATPADIAASRIDFQAWLRILSWQRRRVAQVLATGERTRVAARRFGLSPARISQLRSELRASWAAFQGDTQAMPQQAPMS